MVSPRVVPGYGLSSLRCGRTFPLFAKVSVEDEVRAEHGRYFQGFVRAMKANVVYAVEDGIDPEHAQALAVHTVVSISDGRERERNPAGRMRILEVKVALSRKTQSLRVESGGTSRCGKAERSSDRRKSNHEYPNLRVERSRLTDNRPPWLDAAKSLPHSGARRSTSFGNELHRDPTTASASNGTVVSRFHSPGAGLEGPEAGFAGRCCPWFNSARGQQHQG